MLFCGHQGPELLPTWYVCHSWIALLDGCWSSLFEAIERETEGSTDTFYSCTFFLLPSDWPELSYMVTPNCKGS